MAYRTLSIVASLIIAAIATGNAYGPSLSGDGSPFIAGYIGFVLPAFACVYTFACGMLFNSQLTRKERMQLHLEQRINSLCR